LVRIIIYFKLAIRTETMKKIVIRTMLARENRRMDHEDLDLNEAKRGRVEQAAKLEGITMAEAMERQRGFRYLL
jgi:hypothetical protein